MTDEVIHEMYHLYGTFRNLTDGMLMETAEVIIRQIFENFIRVLNPQS